MILVRTAAPAGAQQGSLCLKKGWGSMFRTYINKEELYQEKFNGDIYISATWPTGTRKAISGTSAALTT